MIASEVGGSGGGGGGGGGVVVAGGGGGGGANPPLIDDTTLAEKVAANLAALGYINSGIGSSPSAPIVMQAPVQNNMLIILLILGVAILLVWYIKRTQK